MYVYTICYLGCVISIYSLMWSQFHTEGESWDLPYTFRLKCSVITNQRRVNPGYLCACTVESDVNLSALQEKYNIVHWHWVDPRQRRQVVELEGYSTHVRRDATVMCQYTEIATKCLTSPAYMFVCKHREQGHFSVFLSTTFQRGKWVRSKGKVICYIYAYVEKKSRNGGIAVLLSWLLKAAGLGQTVMVQNSNYTLEGTIKRRAAACHTNQMLSPVSVSELYKTVVSSPKFCEMWYTFDIMVSCDSQPASQS